MKIPNLIFGRTFLLLLLCPLLLVVLLEFPGGVFQVTHDSSSHASFEYYAARRLQFGTDIIQNVGPLGYVHYAGEYSGYLPVTRILLKSVLRLALGVFVFVMLQRIPSLAAGALWILSILVIFPSEGIFDGYVNEVLSYLTMLLAFFCLNFNSDKRSPALTKLAIHLVISLLALSKNTLFAQAAACYFVTSVALLSGKHFRALLGVVAQALVSFIVIYLLSGQNLSSLPGFFWSIIVFTDQYKEALFEPARVDALLLGAGSALLIMTVVAARLMRGEIHGRHLFLVLLTSILVWQHAFTRADYYHTSVFFAWMVILGPIAGFAQFQPNGPHIPAGRASSTTIGNRSFYALMIVLFFNLGLCLTGLTHSKWQPGLRPALSRLKFNLGWLLAPQQRLDQLELALAQKKLRYRLPQMAEIVGDSRIDVISPELGRILLNDFNYAPRPVPINFGAVTPVCSRLNEDYFNNLSTAPEYVLINIFEALKTFPNQSDGPALLALMRKYSVRLQESGLLLLQRLKNPPEKESYEETILDSDYSFGQVIPLDSDLQEGARLKMKIEMNTRGRLASLVFGPLRARIRIQTAGSQEPKVFRLILGDIERGTLLSPLLGSTGDLAGVFSGNLAPGQKVLSFSVELDDQRLAGYITAARMQVLKTTVVPQSSSVPPSFP